MKLHGWRGWLKCLATSQRGQRIGTEVHALIESFINQTSTPFWSEKYHSHLFADALFDHVNPLVKEWIAIEPHITCQELKIHGTADAIVRLENDKAVLDWKTSAGKSATHPIQLAIYALCWNEKAIAEGLPGPIYTGIIARVDKKSKKLGVKLDVYENLQQYYPVVRALKEIWDYNQKKKVNEG